MAVEKRGSVEGKEVIRRFWVEAFNNANPNVVEEFLGERFMLKDLCSGETLNRQNIKDLIAGLREHVNQPEVEVVDQIQAEGDHIVSHLILRALPIDDYENADPVEINGLTIDRIEGERAVETRLMWDVFTADEHLRPDHSEKLRWRFPWW